MENTINVHSFELGDYKCSVIQDFDQPWTVWELFSNVPKDELEAKLRETGEDPGIRRCGNVLLQQLGTNNILVDAGLPDGNLLQGLEQLGITPRDIDSLVLTHADMDHVGYLDIFDKATVYFPEKAYTMWTTNEDMMIDELARLFQGKAPIEQVKGMEAQRRKFAQEVLPSISARLSRVKEGEAFLNDFTFIESGGHRSDHHALEVRSGDHTLLHVVDTFRLSLQLTKPHLACRFDTYQGLVKAIIPLLAKRAIEKHAIVLGTHITFPGLCQLEEAENGFVMKPLAEVN